MQFAGQAAIVTGAAEGIGLAIATALVRAGARVLLFDINEEKLRSEVRNLREEGADVISVAGSVALVDDVESMCSVAEREFGRIDVLVNNAGISGNRPSLDITSEFWEQVIGVNLTGSFLCSRAAGLRMLQQESGVILNVASMYAITPAPERLAYCVSKSGVAMMARALAAEWGSRGVRVNAIAPGYVHTALISELVEHGRLDLERIKVRTPLGRLAGLDEIAELALFLCSSSAKFITGQVVGIDGGWTAYGYV